jgi:WD40 repeat protein
MTQNICPHCGQSHPAGVHFCPKTGQPIPVAQYCPHCGAAVETTWFVCAACSGRLRAETIRPAAPGIKLFGLLAAAVVGLGILVGGYWLLNRAHSIQLPVLAGTPVPGLRESISPKNAGEVVELARLEKDNISHIAYSPNGKLLAVATSNGTYLYDAVTSEEVHFIETGYRDSSLAFSPDGQVLANAGERTVTLWRVSDWSVLHTLSGFTGGTGRLTFSPDGSLLGTGLGNGTLKIFRVSDWSRLHTLSGHASGSGNLTFSPDGRSLASTDRRTVTLWRVSDWSELRTLSGFTGWIASLAFSPDGGLLGSGLGNGAIKIWRVSDWSELYALGGIYIPEGGDTYSWTAYKSDDDEYALWLISPEGESYLAQPGKPIRPALPGNPGIGEADDNGIPRTIEGYTRLNAIQAATDRNLTNIKFGAAGGKMVRLKSPSEAETFILPETGHAESVLSLAFSPDGSLLASGSVDNTVKLWRVSDWSELGTLIGHTSYVFSLAFSPDGHLLASGSNDGTVRLWGIGP